MELIMTEKRYMTIHFMDGTKAAFDFPQQPGDKSSITTKVNKLMEMQYITIEADNALNFYPVSNIKSIQLYPVPEIVPDTTIRGAVIVDV